MWNRSLSSALVLGVLLALAAPSWAQRGSGRGMQRANNGVVCLALISSTPKQALDATEAAGLAYMRGRRRNLRMMFMQGCMKNGACVFWATFRKARNSTFWCNQVTFGSI